MRQNLQEVHGGLTRDVVQVVLGIISACGPVEAAPCSLVTNNRVETIEQQVWGNRELCRAASNATGAFGGSQGHQDR